MIFQPKGGCATSFGTLGHLFVQNESKRTGYPLPLVPSLNPSSPYFFFYLSFLFVSAIARRNARSARR